MPCHCIFTVIYVHFYFVIYLSNCGHGLRWVILLLSNGISYVCFILHKYTLHNSGKL